MQSAIADFEAAYKKSRVSLKNKYTENMKSRILDLLKKGYHLSELDGIKYGYGTSFRTRISELRADGHIIKDYFVRSAYGSNYKKYYFSNETNDNILSAQQKD
jgi:hypothetical protein